MKTSFLNYSKIILSKVCFDSKLLLKEEYQKAVQLLDHAEVRELEEWLNQEDIEISDLQLAEILQNALKLNSEISQSSLSLNSF